MSVFEKMSNMKKLGQYENMLSNTTVKSLGNCRGDIALAVEQKVNILWT